MPAIYSCPIIDCTWTHHDEGPQPLDADATPDDVNAQNVLHGATVEHAIRAHYETHDAEAWFRTVQALHAELAAREEPLLCVGCLADRHAAQAAGKPLPPQNHARVIAGGSGMCLGHIQIGPPQIPGRTAAGIILGGG